MITSQLLDTVIDASTHNGMPGMCVYDVCNSSMYDFMHLLCCCHAAAATAADNDDDDDDFASTIQSIPSPSFNAQTINWQTDIAHT